MFVTLSHKAISQDSFLSQRGRQLLCVKDTEWKNYSKLVQFVLGYQMLSLVQQQHLLAKKSFKFWCHLSMKLTLRSNQMVYTKTFPVNIFNGNRRQWCPIQSIILQMMNTIKFSWSRSWFYEKSKQCQVFLPSTQNYEKWLLNTFINKKQYNWHFSTRKGTL